MDTMDTGMLKIFGIKTTGITYSVNNEKKNNRCGDGVQAFVGGQNTFTTYYTL